MNLSDIDSDSSEETDSPDNNSEDALDMIAPGRFTSAADNSNYNDNSANANSENSSCSSIKQDKEKKLLPKETYEPVPTGLLSEPSPPKVLIQFSPFYPLKKLVGIYLIIILMIYYPG